MILIVNQQITSSLGKLRQWNITFILNSWTLSPIWLFSNFSFSTMCLCFYSVSLCSLHWSISYSTVYIYNPRSNPPLTCSARSTELFQYEVNIPNLTYTSFEHFPITGSVFNLMNQSSAIDISDQVLKSGKEVKITTEIGNTIMWNLDCISDSEGF